MLPPEGNRGSLRRARIPVPKAMKATLLSMWRESETRVARSPLMLGVLLVVLASVFGLLQDNGMDAINGLLSSPH